MSEVPLYPLAKQVPLRNRVATREGGRERERERENREKRERECALGGGIVH
jgi:hypothetical protein